MIDESIVIGVEDQRSVGSAFLRASLSRRLLLAAAILLPIAIVVGVLLVVSGTAIGWFVLGALAALTLMLVVLLFVARRSANGSAASSLPLGSTLQLRTSAEGMEIAGAVTSSTIDWTSLSAAERIGDGIVLRATDGKAAFLLPGRLVDDEALAEISGAIAGARR